MLKNYVFNMPTKVLYGEGQLGNLSKEQMPGKKALVVISKGGSARRFGYLNRLEEQLDLSKTEFVLFDEVRQNPSEDNVMNGAALAKGEGCDFVIALGGGSVMDCAKSIALMIKNPGKLWDYSQSAKGGNKKPENGAVPIVCIPTSAATGSEVDPTAIMSNDQYNEKSRISFPFMFPVISIVDPELMMSMPSNYTAYQGMDVFYHAAESLLSKSENPIGEMFAIRAIQLVSENLPAVYQDGSNRDARSNMALASSLASYYMYCTSLHRMELAMGSLHSELVHGAGLIMIAHSYFEFLAERHAADEQMKKIAVAMGVKNPTNGFDFVDAYDKLVASVECSTISIKDAGISKDEIPEFVSLIHRILGGDINADPIKLSDEDYTEIYMNSFR